MSNIQTTQHRNTTKRAYTPDLSEFLSQCEVNYLLLLKLVPELQNLYEEDSSNDAVDSRWCLKSSALSLELRATEIARYTTTLDLVIRSPKIKLLKSEKLIIRLYHDAQMLEVMEGSGPGALKAIYEQVKGNQKTVDEKRQVNRFIGECLRNCSRANPVSSETPVDE
ncbi:DUF1249 domain-containing protein [Aliikangiella marina]|uniref:DUF1249 domain-containing protein n=1 Tax=Aliikangiella marina TaxID=1712262 RepID=A0A545T749_9GAMM|nr:DUF1249 domain-containing protein [Aliikangiella marina]TQV73049.1 DUF1249 domain-containing protein [Aliikangiella marina]